MSYESLYLGHLKQFGGPDQYWYGRVTQALKRVAALVESEATTVQYHDFRFKCALWIDEQTKNHAIENAFGPAFEFEKFILADPTYSSSGQELLIDANLNYITEYHFTTFARVKFDSNFYTNS